MSTLNPILTSFLKILESYFMKIKSIIVFIYMW
jgi:hypothetical protein